MTSDFLPALIRGAAVGVGASIVQAAIGASVSATLVPDGENANIAPRLMDRVARRAGKRLSWSQRWALGTAYHLGYGAGWGALYAAAREARPVHPAVGGALLGGAIYGITFPRWGGAVWLDVERDPDVRSPQMEMALAAVTLSFGLVTAVAYEAVRNADDDERPASPVGA